MNPTPGKSPLLDLRGLAASVVGFFGSMVRGAGFWIAILLPALYIPLLLMNHPWVVDTANLTRVVALHVASLVAGKGHAVGFDQD